MIFNGKLLGADFPVMEADSHVDLFQILGHGLERDHVRCWVFVKSTGGPYWLELMVDDDTMFHLLVGNDQLVLDEEGRVSVEIRRKPCRSPNTSPSKTADAAHDLGESLATTQTFSTLETLSNEGGSVAFSNSVDPFTRCAFADLENPLVLRFPRSNAVGADAVFVDKASFEKFVQGSEKEGKSVDQLTISNVEFQDRTVTDLFLDWQVWVESVLPASQELRGSYFNVNVSEKARDSKLRRIKENNSDLWSRITYWIADFGDADALRWIEMPPEPDAPPYMSPFYFSTDEAISLGELTGSSSVLLGDALRAKSSTLTCAAHDLKPLLEKAFRLDPAFHRAPGFLQKKREWVAKREQLYFAPRANEKRSKKTAPTFGSFGIR